MVLQGGPCGRVGRRRTIFDGKAPAPSGCGGFSAFRTMAVTASAHLLRPHQFRVVRQNHRLYPISRPRLREDAAHVRFHRRLREVQAAGDLGVRPALPDDREDLALPFRERGQAWVRTGGVAPGVAGDGRRTRRGGGGSGSGRRPRRRWRPLGCPARSSSGSASLMRKPEAPARRPAYAYSSRSNVVRIRTRVRSPDGDDAAGRLDAVEARHADVHQDDVRVEFGRHADRLAAVGGLAHHRHVVLALQEHAEAEALQGWSSTMSTVVTGAVLSSGRWRWTRQPPVGRRQRAASSVPSYRAVRSRIPVRPRPRRRPVSAGRSAAGVGHPCRGHGASRVAVRDTTTVACRAGAAVLEGVREGLLDDAVDGQLAARREGGPGRPRTVRAYGEARRPVRRR